MKLMTLALIVFSATVAAAQSNPKEAPSIDLKTLPGPNTQAGCPVAFTDVSLQRNGHLMLVRQGAAQSGSLAFQYKNQSGKLIQSIAIRVELKVKKSVYDLDATTITLDMSLIGKDAEEILPLNMLTYGLGRVTLQQVSYSDGTVWTASARSTCGYENPATAEQIGKLQ